MKNNVKIIFIIIFLLAGILRLYGINWDQGFHMHPDERAVILFTNDLAFPHSLESFLSTKSSWNSHFFAYGSLPLYLLYWIAKLLSLFNSEYFSYDYLTIIGRGISLFADLGILSIIFFIGRRLWNEKIALIASAFYGLSVLPIQLSRFYAVDTLLCLFITLTLYLLIRLYEKPSFKIAILVGASLACAFATKISSTVLLVSFFCAIVLDFTLLVVKAPHRPRLWLLHIPKFLKNLISIFATSGIIAIILFAIIQPYVFIDFQEFWKQTLAQAAMTRTAFTFPYTLQYVGKIPYIYDITQIFFIGMGPVLATTCFAGVLIRFLKIVQGKAIGFKRAELILLLFFLSYFFVVGKFAVGFIRYMLPLYPIFCLFGASLIYQIYKKIYYKKIALVLFFLGLIVWPLSFMTIYTKPFTRVEASKWILNEIPANSTLAIEHWDDSLPIYNASQYRYETLTLYDPESSIKWSAIEQSLDKSDYVILASNRLYTPLSKLIHCEKLPQGHCYRETAQYYKDLFSGKLGYKKVAEFKSFAHIPFTQIEFNDQGFDESFSVYDHPVITIFKNTRKN